MKKQPPRITLVQLVGSPIYHALENMETAKCGVSLRKGTSTISGYGTPAEVMKRYGNQPASLCPRCF